jgi:Tfp pilus assembly protein PilO
MTEKLKNFPFILIFVAYVAYLGYQGYAFLKASDGEVEQHKTAMLASQNEITVLKKKLIDGKKFMQSLDVKKTEIQGQVRKLVSYQGALSEAPDVPSLIKLLLTEAKKLEMKVDRIEPGKKVQKEYYLEQEFKLEVRGSYQQILLFSSRVAQLQRILRIEAYDLKQSPISINTKAITLQGSLSVRAYQYTLSKEDQIGKGGALK